MKDWKKILPLIIRGGELLILAALVFAVVYFIPDPGRQPASQTAGQKEETDIYETEQAGSGQEEIPQTDAAQGESASVTEDSDRKYSAGKKSQEKEEEVPEEEIKGPPVLFLATDIHYQSPEMTDYRSAFDNFVQWSDGTIVPYLDAITDAFLEEVVRERPSALILSGDISQNGERKNHEALAEKLHRVQESGIPVLVIPGNHDINHPWAATYFDGKTETAEGTAPEDFYEIYHEFGYDGASSRDQGSLSYVYRIDDRYWVMMLDSCIYEPVHETGGRIRTETLEWMKAQLEEAAAAGATIIPVAHHNLLKESTLYPEECTLENGTEVTELLEEYKIPVYLSGHLHLQRIKKHVNGPSSEDGYGIYEIVTSPLTMSPCQYSVLEWQEDGSLVYHTQKVDVENWALRYGEEDENLLNFSAYADEFLIKTVANQAFMGLETIPEERKQQMAELYGRLNRDYCSGKKISAGEIKKTEAYLYWERYGGTGVWADRLEAILNDTKRDHTFLSLTAGEDFPGIPGENEETQADVEPTSEDR